MRHEDARRLEAEGPRLRVRGLGELGRGDVDGRQAPALQLGRVVHTARRAGPSIGEGLHDRVAPDADLTPQVDGRRLGERRLPEAQDLDAPGGEQLLQPVQEDVPTGLGDVEQADCQPLERRGPGHAPPGGGLALTGRIEQLRSGHSRTSLVTGWLPTSPLAQPPIMAENMPAVPPAWTISRPPGRNLGIGAAAMPWGMPSAMPPAPRTISEPGRRSRPSSSSRRRDLDHPASRKTRACSGDTTRTASHARASLGWATTWRQAAKVPASDSGVRDCWSTSGCTPEPANSVTAEVPTATPRSTASGSHGEPRSSSAKQNVYLPGLPWVARSTPPGRPPPTLRTTSWSARPMVALARLPWPSALPPEFIPI